MISNKEKFQKLDILIEGAANRRTFVSQNEVKLPFYQEYKLITYETNNEEFERISHEMNEFLSKYSNSDLSYQAEQLEKYSSDLEKVSQVPVECGKIKCTLEDNLIKISVESEVENKEFIYEEGEYLTDLRDYLDKDLNSKLTKKWAEEKRI